MKKGFLHILFTLIAIPSVAQVLPMDYSYCGYQRSEKPIPSAPVAVYIEPHGADDAAAIQQAIDWVAQQKPDRVTGLRGAVLLAEGEFSLSAPLRIRTSGIVLRGCGRDKTVLRKTGYDRGAAIYIEGCHDWTPRDTVDLADAQTGATTVCALLPAKAFTPGSRVMVWRPSTKEWIESLGCQSFGGGQRMGYWAWHPGDVDLRWNRTILAVNGREITLDAPLTMTLDKRWADTKAIVYEQPGLIAECGVENLTLVSDYDQMRPKDEDHCWDGVCIADAENCWVRMVNFRHFAGSAVVVQKSAWQVTVEDCKSLEPVSEIGGLRRRTFLTLGEKTLFQRCYSEQGINDFAVGHTAPGPNAFVQCESYESLGPSGSIGSWAPGLLYDIVNIDGHDLVFRNWELEKFGAGWNTANSTMWQCTASGLFCYSPDSVNQNHSIGCWGQVMGNGDYQQMNEHVKPYSLFQQQLLTRLPNDATVKARCRIYERNTTASSSPTMDVAMKMAKESWQPRVTMAMWIDSARLDGDTRPRRAFVYRPVSHARVIPIHYEVRNGWLTANGAALMGGKHQTPWWSGRTLESYLPKAKPALTRFVPGQEGLGLTDRVDSVVDFMKRTHTVIFSQNYGLWTDRRRDDHERIRRKNGDAWAPFYEQPFARSGEGTAWDGMSKFDLTQLNRWYFYRLRDFAEKAQSNGILLKQQHYFQHNILEAGAHWVDCPWRTANNINRTPFLEPVNFTGDKRIFTAEQFYDVENPTLRNLHRHYIRQMLDAFRDQPNVIHSIGEEFTGPLHFVQFWLDVVAEWEAENGHVLVALAVNKDVQDAIMSDPKRAQVVDIIDIEQWYYHQKGLYAPQGGVNMAQRQYLRKIRTGGVRFEDAYRSVQEVKAAHPDKVVVYSGQKYPEMAWAALMAGGSCAAIPVTDRRFLTDIVSMKPTKMNGYCLLEGSEGRVVYLAEGGGIEIMLPQGQTFDVYQIDTQKGTLKKVEQATKSTVLKGAKAFWLHKK